MEYKWIVYITINRCNGNFYFGVHKTINPDVFDGYIGRGVTSMSQAKYLQTLGKQNGSNSPFINAVVKYGYENFKRTTIKVFDNEEDAYKLEEIIVNERLLKCKNCYNVALGGKIGMTEIVKRKVYQFDLNGNFLRSFKSIQEAADTIKIDQANIVACLNGRQHQSGGFYWNYEKKFEYNPYEPEKKVCQYTLSGKFIAMYDSLKEAKIAVGSTTISRAIKNKSMAKGYQWRHFNGSYDDIEPYKMKTAKDYRDKKKDGDIV